MMKHNFKVGQKYTNGGSQLEILFIGERRVFVRYENSYSTGETSYFFSEMLSWKLVVPKIKKKLFLFTYRNHPGIYTYTDDFTAAHGHGPQTKTIEEQRESFKKSSAISWVSKIKEVEFDDPESQKGS